MATRKRAPNAKPPKRVDRRKTMSTRIRPETRAQLDAAVAQSGRSLAQEIEIRLEQSFKVEERARDIAAQSAGAVYAQFGRPETFQFLALLAQAIRFMETKLNRDNWLKDPVLFKETGVALNTMLKVFGPLESEARTGLLVAGLKAEQSKHLGEEAAIQAIEAWEERMALADVLGRKA